MQPKSILQWNHIDDEFPLSPNWRCLIAIHEGNNRFVIWPAVFSFDAGVFISLDTDEEEFPCSEMSYWARLPDAMEIR